MSAPQPSSQQTVAIATLGDMELVVPRCERGIGSIIRAADSMDLIDGVCLQSLSIWPDDRGYFFEIMRSGEGLVSAYPASSTQVSAALGYPGTVKAFHYHLRQTDCWAAAVGMLQVALIDLRKGSRTFGRRNTLYAGALRPALILIPPGVGHGYKVIGDRPAVLLYVTDRFYNPEDEGRLAHDDASINYDWGTQHK